MVTELSSRCPIAENRVRPLSREHCAPQRAHRHRCTQVTARFRKLGRSGLNASAKLAPLDHLRLGVGTSGQESFLCVQPARCPQGQAAILGSAFARLRYSRTFMTRRALATICRFPFRLRIPHQGHFPRPRSPQRRSSRLMRRRSS